MRPDRDRQAERLRNRFRAVSNRAMRWPGTRQKLRSWGLRLLLISSVFALVWLAIAGASPWPVPVTLRHLAASQNCDTARAMGLAPARRGEPGYWPELDADGDGIACEVWPTARSR